MLKNLTINYRSHLILKFFDSVENQRIFTRIIILEIVMSYFENIKENLIKKIEILIDLTFTEK